MQEITTYHDAVFALAHYYDNHPNIAESDPEVIRLRGLMDKLESRKPSNSGFAPHDKFKNTAETITYWFNQGLTQAEIAKEMQVTKGAINYQMKKLNLSRSNRVMSIKTLRHEIASGLSVSHMYEQHKVLPGVIQQQIAENGLKGRYDAIQKAKHEMVYLTPNGGHHEYESRAELRRAERLLNTNKYKLARENGRVMNRFDWLKTQGVRL